MLEIQISLSAEALSALKGLTEAITLLAGSKASLPEVRPQTVAKAEVKAKPAEVKEAPEAEKPEAKPVEEAPKAFTIADVRKAIRPKLESHRDEIEDILRSFGATKGVSTLPEEARGPAIDAIEALA